MIPKIIHACWLGQAEMPPRYQAFIEGWRRLHPDWEIRIWTDADFTPYLDDSAFVKDAIAKKKYGFLSDYFRLKVLYLFGGIYVDTDVEIYKPFDPLLDCNMFLGFLYDSLLGTAVLASEKGNPILAEWLNILEKDYEEKREFTISNNWVTKYFLGTFPEFRLNGKRQTLQSGIEIYPKDWFERYHGKHKSGGGYMQTFLRQFVERRTAIPRMEAGLEKDFAAESDRIFGA